MEEEGRGIDRIARLCIRPRGCGESVVSWDEVMRRADEGRYRTMTLSLRLVSLSARQLVSHALAARHLPTGSIQCRLMHM